VLPKLPKSALEKAPIAGFDPLRLSFPQMLRPQPRTAEPIDFWSRAAAPQPQPLNLSDVKAESPVVDDLSGTLGPGRAALMQLQHPEAAERTVIIMTAGISDDPRGSKARGTCRSGGCREIFLVNLGKQSLKPIAPDRAITWVGRMPANRFHQLAPILSLVALLTILLALCGSPHAQRRRRQG
jgi:hypothetical protein